MSDEIYYNLAAALILVTIFSALLFRRMTKGVLNKAFLNFVVATFFSAVVSTFCILIDGKNGYSSSFKLAMNMLFYVFRNIAFGLCPVYIIAVTDTRHKLGKGIYRLLAYVPFLGTILCVISTLFSSYVFSIDSNGYLIKGPGIILLYALNAIYLVYPLVIVYLYKDILGPKKSVALVFCSLTGVFAYAIGQILPFLHVDLICYAVGILFIMLIVQNPEMRLDSQSGFLRRETYFDDLKIGFMSDKRMTIIHINICQFEQITNILSYEKLGVLIRQLSSRLELMCRKLSLRCELYYIKDGKFRIILSAESMNDAEKAAKVFQKIFNDSDITADTAFEIKSVICITRVPEDVNDFEMFYDFESLLDDSDIKGKVFRASALLNNKDYNLVSHLGEIIDKGINSGRFEVYYQPIFDTRTERYSSCEALLRLNDEKFGEIPPELFIPAAEKDGSIYRLGEFVIEEVCKFIKDKNFERLHLDHVEINLSVYQCLQKGLPDTIKTIVDKYGVDYSKLNFEVKESLATETQKVFSDNIKAISDMGMLVSLDDFGTGYYNISNISSLPFSMIKFDKSFTNIGDNEKLEAILYNAIEMIRGIGKEVVIEGVESDDMYRRMELLSCEYLQGFYFAKAMPKEQFAFFIQEYEFSGKIGKI